MAQKIFLALEKYETIYLKIGQFLGYQIGPYTRKHFHPVKLSDRTSIFLHKIHILYYLTVKKSKSIICIALHQ